MPSPPPDSGPRIAEAVALGVAGAALAAPIGLVAGLGPIPSIVAAGNGVISGWRATYDWARPAGWVAFVLDSTWGLLTTTAALVAHAIARTQRGGGYQAHISRRANRHVYARGLAPRKGFLTTIGNTINGAGDVTGPRRTRLITDHEDVHCWQARWFGPLFPPLYFGWMVVGGAAGAVMWAISRPIGRAGLAAPTEDAGPPAGRSRPRDARLTKMMETVGYHLNPFEWWAYSRDDNWPPSGKVPGVGWRAPIAQPLSAARARKRARRMARERGF